MDKDEQQHLTEYRAELKSLHVRCIVMEKLIKNLESKEEITVTAQHDFPNYGKYDGTSTNRTIPTDKEVMNED